jgi:hypothetical protein
MENELALLPDLEGEFALQKLSTGYQQACWRRFCGMDFHLSVIRSPLAGGAGRLRPRRRPSRAPRDFVGSGAVSPSVSLWGLFSEVGWFFFATFFLLAPHVKN